MAHQGNWNTLPVIAVRPGISRQVFSGKNCMMVLNEIKPGLVPRLHSHPHEQLLQILSGSAKVVLGDEVLTLKAGDVVHVPPDLPHSLEVLGDETVMNMDIFSPIREDYL